MSQTNTETMDAAAAVGSTIKGSTFFSAALLAIVITALIVAVGMYWSQSCVLPGGGRSVDAFQAAGGAATRTVAAVAQPQPAPPNLLQAAMAASSVEGFQATNNPALDEAVIIAAEGFAGAVRGSGGVDCMEKSSDAAACYAILSKRAMGTEEGPDDLRELRVLLGKISCLKQDLTSPGSVVTATRTQPFTTSHDMEPVAETAARCFAHTIPQRDLSLILDKWGSRGTLLIKRICTSADLRESEEKEALDAFGRAMADIQDVAMGRCCETGGPPSIAGQNQPRMVGGYEPPALVGLRDYKGYY